MTAVARRQLREVTDGTYTRGTWDDVQANRAPAGVTWTYQWGVTLYGLLRASEATRIAVLNRKARSLPASKRRNNRMPIVERVEAELRLCNDRSNDGWKQ